MSHRAAVTTAPRGQCQCRRLAVTWLSMCAVCRERYPAPNEVDDDV